MSQSRTKTPIRIAAFLLAFLTVLGILPISPFLLTANAASYPNSRNIPEEMLDNVFLDALAYLGWHLDDLRNEDHLYRHGWHSGDLLNKHPELASPVPYGGRANGLEKTSDGTPDVQAMISKGGLQCADFVTYVYGNYLPSVAGIDTTWLVDAVKPHGTRKPSGWLAALRELSENGEGKVEKLYDITDPDWSLIPDIQKFWSTGVSTDILIDYSRLTMGDIIIFASETNSAVHMGIYMGTCDDGNGARWKNCHFMIDNNYGRQNIMLIEYMASGGAKPTNELPVAVFHINNETESRGTIEVKKTSDTGKPLGGAVFTATNIDTKEKIVIGPTDSTGYASAPVNTVPFGTYEVVETTFPAGYTSSTTSKWTVTINKDTPAAKVTINAVNNEVPGTGKIVKHSEDGKISGIRFHIAGTSNSGVSVNKDVTTGTDGTISESLRPGTYTVTELSSDEYVPQTAQTVTVVSGRTSTVTFSNTLKRGSLTVTKTSFDGFVDGRQFHLYGTSDAGLEVNEYATVGADGIAKFENVLVGSNYKLEEINVPDYYIVPNVQNVTIEWNVVTEKSVYNDEKTGSGRVIKKSEYGSVEGLTFRLTGTADSGEKIDVTATTNSSGIATFDDLPVGKCYRIEEIEVPAYYITPAAQYIDVTEDGTAAVTFNNQIKRGDLAVLKSAEDGKVSGRTFRLHGTADCGMPIDTTASTDSSGKASFRDIPIGTYTIEETGTPEWYIIPSPQSVTISSDEIIERGFDNRLKRGDLIITKTAFDGFVEGVRFHLTGVSDSGITVDEYTTTNEDGVAEFRDILVGKNYRLEEVGAAEYYVIPDIENVNIAWNDVTARSAYNGPKLGNLTVHKTSEDDEVQGRRFHLYGMSDANIPVDEYAVTDEFGTAYFTDILIGRYTLEEVGTPEKYIIPTPQIVDIMYDTTVEKSFYNKLNRGDLDVIKNSEDGFVQGMKFHLFGESLQGEYVDMYAVTGADGIAHFKDVLISGETPYTIEEVETAVRYVVPEAQTAPIEWEKVTERAFVNVLKKWRVTIKKVDGRTTTPQGDGTLAGAVYGIYRGDELVDTYTTDENGQFVSKYYVCGDDWIIREISPSEGYLLDNTEYHIGAEAYRYEIEYNDLTKTVTESAKYGNIAIIKHTDNGDTQIETPEVGAKFEIFLKAAGSYANAKESERDILICDELGFAQSKELPYGVYTVHQTDGWDGSEKIADFDVFICEDGKTYNFLINNHQFESYIRVVKIDAETGKPIPVAGVGFKLYDPDENKITMTYTYPTVTTVDTFYSNENGYLVTPEKLPFGRGYSVVEVSAPYGYVLDSTPVYFDVTEDNSEREELLIIIEVEKADMPQKGMITVTKTGEVFASVAEANGVYVPVYEVRPLAGAVYEIIAAEDIYTPDGTLRYAVGTVVDAVTTDADGTAASIALYLGKYTVREVTAPYGYLLNDTPVNVELVYAGENIELTEAAASFVNDRQHVSVSLKKIMKSSELFGIGSGDEILNVKFGLFAKNDISASDGSIIPSDGLLEVISVDEYGIGRFTVDLPFGEYYVREIATDEHYVLSDTKYPVVFGYTGQDEATVEIEIGRIENKLIYGSIRGHKTDRETGAYIAGAVFGLFRPDETVFTTENAILTAVSDFNGIFTFENVPYGKWTIYELAPADGYLPNEEIYEVEVKSDEEVIVINALNDMIPEIKTTATVNGEHDIHTNTTVTVKDAVEYRHLIPGKEYVMRGVLMDKSTGKPFIVNGTEVMAEATFIPGSPSGTIVLEYTFDGSVITEDTVLVVFETLYRDGKALASHADLNDVGQTVSVHVPEIGTTATADDSHKTHSNEKIEIVDIIMYENLIIGKAYTVKGILIDKSTGKAFLANGKAVTAETAFVAESESGEVTVTFVFDGSGIEVDTTLVAFESLYHNGYELAIHTDIDDADQTVTVLVPKIGTTASVEGEKSVHPNTKITIEDVVSYENLIPGREYVLRGVLMNKATGEPFPVDGKEVVSEINFIPDSASGTVAVTFTFSGADIGENTNIVVFERLFYKGYEVAAHADIDDEGQTVTVYVPEIGTTATTDGCHTTHPKDTIEIIDVVRYENLIVGKTYTVKGILIDKSTGEPFLVNGESVTAETTFVAESKSGEVAVTFVFDGSGIEADTTLVVFESLYHDDFELAVHADIEDDDQTVTVLVPEIGTTATADGGHTTHPNEKIEIVDIVRYENLIVGKTYTVKGILIDKSTGKPFLTDGVSVTAETTFVAESDSGEVAVTFVFDGSGITIDTSIVAFETLYHEGRKLAVHADIEDEDQTVTVLVPEIGTTASVDCEKSVHPNTEITIEDVVRYENLIPGREYVLRGVLMNKATGEPFPVDGKEVVSIVTFTPDSASGTVTVTFTFSGNDIDENTDIVVFERLFYKDYEVAAHADLNDEGQTVTVYVPEIGTTATADGGHATHPNEKIEIVDIVKYENLIVGKTYTVKGILIDKSTSEPFLVSGESVTAETTFVAESESGEVAVTFVFDGSGIEADTTLVAFESLYHDDFELAVHADIEDEDQSVAVLVPEIGTTATADGGHTTHQNEKIEIVDIVRYENLIIGKTYTVKGVLMDKATGEPFLVSGVSVTAETIFVAESESGEVAVTFVFDGSGIETDTTLVAFESLYHNGYELAVHADIDDADQTVTVLVPEIGTTATVNGNKTTETSSEIVIEDEVRYEGLIPGKEYVLRGVLMDKATGKPYTIDGKDITSETIFTPDSPSGKITVTFSFDGADITSDTELVVFEMLYLDNSVIAHHADINDMDQTVKIIPKREIPKTGDESPNPLVPIMLMLFSICGAAVCLISVRKHKKAR